MLSSAIGSLFRIPRGEPELMRAQVKAFSSQVPLLYLILVVNSAALAATHFGVAPLWLTITFPSLMAILCVARAYVWFRRGPEAVSDAVLVRRLQTTIALSGALGALFLCWSLALYPYGDAHAQGHIAFFVGITVVSCIVCLMHLRPAALLLTGVVVIPFAIFFASTGEPAFMAIALNMVLVSAAMIYILLGYSRDFASMITFQKKLIQTHEAETLRARANAEAELAAQREISKHARRFELALNQMLHGLCMFDREGRLIVCNEQYGRMYSLPEALTRPGTLYRDIAAYRLAQLGYLNLADVPQPKTVDLTQSEATITRELADGRTILVRSQPIKEGGWIATHDDVSERRKAEERLHHMARHDALTGLGNRFHLQERMAAAVAGLSRGEAFAVLCLDLDHFKEANDALGHAIGDAVLREVAVRLRSCVREVDTVARMGGDEFAILQGGIAGPEQSADLAERLLRALTRPYEIEDQRIHIGASIGIALAPRDESAGALVLRLADIALYRAKAEERQTYRFFEPEMDAELQSRHRLESDLRKALVEGELQLYFQPINDAKTRAILSFEALVRWNHPENGMIPPDVFIPVAEQTGMIVALGEWVLRKACEEAVLWPSDVRVSVNLSARQFTGDLVGTVRKALADFGLAPRRLELEITESVLLAGGGDNLAILHALRGLGAKIAMDDFGTGYSSLSYLRSFPFDKIKIDQSFVRNIDQRDSREIVRAVAGLGRTLGMTTTAEGVETEEQLEKIIAYQCSEVQGYLFSRPVPASELAGLLAKFQPARRVA